MQIDEVLAGCAGDSAIQFIEMRLGDVGQNKWGPNAFLGETVGRARLVFFDAAGLQTGELVFAHDAPVGAELNPSVLIATAAFAAIPGAPTADFIVPANLVTPDGQVCFTHNPANTVFLVNLCLSYGAFTGAEQVDTHGNPNGAPAPPLPTSDASSLKRTRNLDTFEVHSNADFTIGTPAPKNAAGATVHLAAIGGACVVAPSPCDASPRAGCQTPAVAGKSLLMLKGGAAAEKNQLLWKWLNGSATSKADFGDPTTTTDYALCVYDATLSLVDGAAIPAGGLCAAGTPCWKEQATGFEYKDKDLTPDGIAQLKLKAGASGKAQIQVKGKGANVPLPAIPLAQPVRVQLQAPNGTACWEALYSAPATQNSSSGGVRIFKDKVD